MWSKRLISFALTEEQRVAQATVREFAQAALRPNSRKADDADRLDPGTLQAIWSMEIVQAQAMGTGPDDGRSPVLNSLILEELGAADATAALAAAAPMAFVQAIADQGSADQRRSLLPLFTADRFAAAAVAVMEPRFQFDVAALQTSAARNGGSYTLSGRKSMIPFAADCSHFLVVAQADGGQDAFIVPRDAAGVRVGPPPGTVGLRALALSDVEFDGVEVPAAMRLGAHNGCDVQRLIDSARTGIAAILTGMSRGILDYCVPYLKERVVHGAPLARKQVIAFRLADMHIEIEAMRWMSWRAASELEQHRPATRSAQLAYVYAADRAMSIADEAVQAFGGQGFVRAHPIEMWYRNARALSVLEGIAGI
jgi:alkylation response protein AidB-like acyl-CoA dehydrogenase